MARDLVPFPLESGKQAPGTTQLHGYCTPWCNQSEEKEAAAVSEHTPWCESTSYGGVKAHDAGGELHEVWFSRVGPYLHGTYAEDLDLRLAYQKDICILTACDSDVEEQRLYITSAEARQLAAALLFLADNAEMLDRPLNGRR